MSAPEAIVPPAEHDWLSQEDQDALMASDWWFSMVAPAELKAQYQGKHVAICGERIVDADADFAELARRLDESDGAAPMMRTLIRYIPPDGPIGRGW